MRLALWFLVTSLVIAVTATITKSDAECPDGWRYLPASDKCYMILNKGLTFDEATAMCIEGGGTLASINKEEETDFAGDLARSASLSVVRHAHREVMNAASFCFGLRAEGDLTWWTPLDCNSREAALCQRKRVKTLQSTSPDALLTAISTLQETAQQIRSFETQLEETRRSEAVGRERLTMLEKEGRERIQSLEDKVNQIWWKDDDLARLMSVETQLGAVRLAEEQGRERMASLEERLDKLLNIKETERVKSLESQLEAMREKEEAGRELTKSLQHQLKDQWYKQKLLTAVMAALAVMLAISEHFRNKDANVPDGNDVVKSDEILSDDPSFEQVDGDENNE